jgi:broad specificity phosphatase PhoE
MIAYFVRHGETDWNKQKRFQGREDIPLNESGVRQARELGESYFKDKKILAIFTSPLKRAVMTGEEISKACSKSALNPEKIPVIVDNRLIERDLGDMSGLTQQERHALREKGPIQNMEPLGEVMERMYECLVDVVEGGGAKAVLRARASTASEMKTVIGAEVTTDSGMKTVIGAGLSTDSGMKTVIGAEVTTDSSNKPVENEGVVGEGERGGSGALENKSVYRGLKLEVRHEAEKRGIDIEGLCAGHVPGKSGIVNSRHEDEKARGLDTLQFGAVRDLSREYVLEETELTEEELKEPCCLFVSHGAAINAILSLLTAGEIGSGKTPVYNASVAVIKQEKEEKLGFKVCKINQQ